MKKLFIIGDSISIHYGPFLEKNVEGVFEYGRKGIDDHVYRSDTIKKGMNIGSSHSMVVYLQEKKEEGFYCDVLVLNCGLHDIKINIKTGERVCDILQYEKNIKQSVDIAAGLCDKLICVTTTHFNEERHTELNTDNYRYTKDNDEYKNVSEKIIKDNAITMMDLGKYTKTLGKNLRSDHVHFEDRVVEKQGSYLAEVLLQL